MVPAIFQSYAPAFFNVYIMIFFYLTLQTAVSIETAQPLSCEERIRRNWSFLKANLKQNRIRDKFIDSGIWDVCAFDDIDAQKTGLEKNEMFLNQLIKSGSKGYAVFIAALEEKGSTHIIKRLQDTPIRMDVDSSEQSGKHAIKH